MDARGIVVIVALGLLPGCATVEVAVAPGHGAVVLDAAGQYARLDEGVSDLPADAHVDDFDLREQTQGGTFTALSADGVPMRVGDPTVSYTLPAGELVALDCELGADGVQPLVARVVQATVGRVLAGYRFDALDPDTVRAAQARIIALAKAALAPHHIALDSVELKGITAELPALAHTVTATAIWEQRAAEAVTDVDVARERADGLRARAEGLAAANRSIAPTLDAGVLAQKRDQAWAKLVASPRATVEVLSDSSTHLEVVP
ncbi:MAG TPA: SPFH domain-containing protein [Polyangia bacterium]